MVPADRFATVHFGGVCESGIACTGSRDLYDDFGVAASPTTELASIIYSDDQYHPGSPNTSGCDASTSNSRTCDHTAIATQTSGSGIFAVARRRSDDPGPASDQCPIASGTEPLRASAPCPRTLLPPSSPR